jgi:L-lactate dehydrogenase
VDHGVVTGAISNSHHTCALAAYLRRVAERGYVAQISASNPAASRMAPFGGTEPLLTPNPMAAGFPTLGDPVMIDVSCSITTTTMTATLARRGERFPEAWALTATGVPTDDPTEVVERKGSLMPLGGALKGHKGYSLALMVDLMGQGLAGHGRADAPKTISQAVFLQVIDPDAFGGKDAFLRQSTHLAEACRANRPAPGVSSVRVPGDSATRKRRQALAEGVPVAKAMVGTLRERAVALGVQVPVQLAAQV